MLADAQSHEAILPRRDRHGDTPLQSASLVGDGQPFDKVVGAFRRVVQVGDGGWDGEIERQPRCGQGWLGQGKGAVGGEGIEPQSILHEVGNPIRIGICLGLAGQRWKCRFESARGQGDHRQGCRVSHEAGANLRSDPQQVGTSWNQLGAGELAVEREGRAGLGDDGRAGQAADIGQGDVVKVAPVIDIGAIK